MLERHTGLDFGPSEFAKLWEHPKATMFEEDYSKSERYKMIQRICGLSEQKLKEASKTPFFKFKEDGWWGEVKMKTLSDMRPYYGRAEWYETLYEGFCGTSANKLEQLLATRGYKRFFIAFDECSEPGEQTSKLASGKGSSLDRLSLGAMRRIMKAGDTSSGIWYILCDAAFSVLGHIPGNEAIGPSARLCRDPDPLPPWSFYEFDHMLRREPKIGILTPLEACMFKHLKMYGRSVSAFSLYLYIIF